MEQKTAHWGWFLARRALVWTLWGTLFGAIWGAVCIAAAGFSIGLVMDFYFNRQSGGNGFSFFQISFMGASIGLQFGAVCGAGAGALAWLVWSLTSAPSRRLIPPRDLSKRMLKSFFFGALVGTCVYFSACALISLLLGAEFFSAMDDYVVAALFGVPATMVLAQILALFLTRRPLAQPASEQNAPEISD